jgi:sulfur carrier protein
MPFTRHTAFLLRKGMKLTVNGKPEETAPCSLLEYIYQKGMSPDGIVVELNYKIVKKADFPNIQLQEGDSLELLSFVGGG